MPAKGGGKEGKGKAKGDGKKGGKTGGKKGGAGAGRGNGGKGGNQDQGGKADQGGKKGDGKGNKREASEPPAQRESAKVFEQCWARQGDHETKGKAGMCMWYRVKNACSNPPPCPFSHDKKIKLEEWERKICEQEMAIRYAYNNGKQPTAEQRASSKGARARTPSQPNNKP